MSNVMKFVSFTRFSARVEANGVAAADLVYPPFALLEGDRYPTWRAMTVSSHLTARQWAVEPSAGSSGVCRHEDEPPMHWQ